MKVFIITFIAMMIMYYLGHWMGVCETEEKHKEEMEALIKTLKELIK